MRVGSIFKKTRKKYAILTAAVLSFGMLFGGKSIPCYGFSNENTGHLSVIPEIPRGTGKNEVGHCNKKIARIDRVNTDAIHNHQQNRDHHVLESHSADRRKGSGDIKNLCKMNTLSKDADKPCACKSHRHGSCAETICSMPNMSDGNDDASSMEAIMTIEDRHEITGSIDKVSVQRVKFISGYIFPIERPPLV